MDEDMIKRWNSVVRKTDTVFHIGDFSFYHDFSKVAHVRSRLNGHIILIPGNHDEEERRKYGLKEFETIMEVAPYLITMKHEGSNVIMCHYPLEEWRRAVMLHGHQHGNGLKKHMRLDVGVDCHNMYPIELGKAIKLARDIPPNTNRT